MYFIKKYDPRENEHDQIEMNTDSKKNISTKDIISWLKYTIIILIAVALSTTTSAYKSHQQYGPTYYQYLPIGIKAEKAAEITTVMLIFFTIGRFSAVFETQIMSTELMITIHTIIAIFSQILLYFGQNIEIIIWIASAFIGN